MRKFLLAHLLLLLFYSFTLLLFSKSAFAKETCDPEEEGTWKHDCTQNVCPYDASVGVGVPYHCEGGFWVNKNPSGECTPQCAPATGGECSWGSWKYECVSEKQCPTDPSIGVGIPYYCDHGTWVNTNPFGECTPECVLSSAKFTPKHYSLENSIGNFNESMEGEVHSGTRDESIDDSIPDNFGAVAALIPAGGPNHELRVNFVRDYPDNKVYLGKDSNGPKTARQIWNDCTENGELANWRNYQEKLENCPEWGFIPTTARLLAGDALPEVKTKSGYFTENQSPLALTWSSLIEFLQKAICFFFGRFNFCQDTNLLALKNPEDAPSWTKDKPNVPAEALDNAKLLRQLLLPEGLSVSELPKSDKTYFDTNDPNTQKLLDDTGKTAEQTSAEGGLFRIFRPTGIDANPAFCRESVRSPKEGCASEFYYQITDSQLDESCPNNICYTDTPDWEVENTSDWWNQNRVTDDRPLYLRTGMEFFQQGLWPAGL